MAQTTFEKGVEQGIQIAQTTFEKGVERGQRDLLWRLIQQRFGPVPETVRQRFDAWPANRLDDLTMSVLTAASLRDLGLADK